MPIYEYQCQECGEHFDKFLRSMLREVEVSCPSCGSSNVQKAFSLFASRGTTGGSAALPAASNCAPTG